MNSVAIHMSEDSTNTTNTEQHAGCLVRRQSVEVALDRMTKFLSLSDCVGSEHVVKDDIYAFSPTAFKNVCATGTQNYQQTLLATQQHRDQYLNMPGNGPVGLQSLRGMSNFDIEWLYDLDIRNNV